MSFTDHGYRMEEMRTQQQQLYWPFCLPHRLSLPPQQLIYLVADTLGLRLSRLSGSALLKGFIGRRSQCQIKRVLIDGPRGC